MYLSKVSVCDCVRSDKNLIIINKIPYKSLLGIVTRKKRNTRMSNLKQLSFHGMVYVKKKKLHFFFYKKIILRNQLFKILTYVFKLSCPFLTIVFLRDKKMFQHNSK